MIVALLIFFLACAIGWRFPRESILSLPLFLPAYITRFHIGPLPTTALECILLGIVLGISVKTHGTVWKEGWHAARVWRIPIIFWMLVTLLAIAVAQDHVAALGLWRAYVLEPIAIAVLVFAIRKNQHDDAWIIASFALSAVFVAVWTIVQFVTGYGIPHPWNTDIETRRATGPFGFPNAVALFVAPIGALCLGWIMRGGRLKWIPWIGLLSTIIATLLARSTGGALGLTAAVGLVVLIHQRTRIPALAAGILGLVLVFSIPSARERVLKKITFNEWSGKVRIVIWKETVNMLRDRPVFGAGLGGYPDGIKPYHTATWMEIFQYPHNIVLNLWSEVGLLGLAAFTYIAITWTRVAWKDRRWMILPLVAILVHGVVDVPYFKNDLAVAFWMFATLATPLTVAQNPDSKNRAEGRALA